MAAHTSTREPLNKVPQVTLWFDDLELEWDTAEARLKPRDGTAWTDVDDKIDTVLRDLRSTNPDPGAETAALTTLLGALA